jgi:hypothetical protein
MSDYILTRIFSTCAGILLHIIYICNKFKHCCMFQIILWLWNIVYILLNILFIDTWWHFRLYYDCGILFIFYWTSYLLILDDISDYIMTVEYCLYLIEHPIYWYLMTFQIVFRLWKIVPPSRADSHTPPAEYRNSYKDFHDDDRCHSKSSLNKLKYLFLLVSFHWNNSDKELKDYWDVIYTIMLDCAGFFIICLYVAVGDPVIKWASH